MNFWFYMWAAERAQQREPLKFDPRPMTDGDLWVFSIGAALVVGVVACAAFDIWRVHRAYDSGAK